jgi:SAM-dependent MidA family methyltransferase
MELTPGLRRDPAPDLEAVGEDEALVARIRDEIRRDGPMPFVRFMDLALYDPAGGYYRGSEARPGRTGDFITAPEAHPIFGRAVARVLDETWRRLGEPARFVVREYGAGDGTLALAILDGLRRDGSGLERAIAYDPVEVEPRRIEAIASRLADARWADILAGPATVAEPIVGAVLGNEVLDALPVHRVRRREDALVELAVGLDGDRLIEVEIEPTTPALAERLASEGVELVDGQTAEICLALERWVGDAAAGLARGLLLLIDYGAIAAELYDPVRRRDGTLRAYIRHRVHDDPYRHVGRQDLTAHVDVTAVERAAVAAGLEHLATLTQAEFLVGAGTDELLRAIQSDPATSMEAYLEVRSALMRMLDPAAMGRFRVMAFGRDWPVGPPLAAFAYRLPERSRRPPTATPAANEPTTPD